MSAALESHDPQKNGSLTQCKLRFELSTMQLDLELGFQKKKAHKGHHEISQVLFQKIKSGFLIQDTPNIH